MQDQVYQHNNNVPGWCLCTVIDSKDYELKGISEEFRGNLSHLVTHAVTQRIDAHLEQINCHPMEIRRYYRQFDY